MSETHLSKRELSKVVWSRLLLSIPALGALFFLPAGTLAYWEAWLYLAILLIPMLMVFAYLLRNDPELLERRMRMREKEAQQKRIISLSWLYFLLVFLIPGFDQRFGWSDVPISVVLAADGVVALGYGVFFLTLRENSYASRVVEVAQGQKVIRSGPYARVRHPMYLGAILMYTASPIALGSWWAFIPALLIIPLLVARIRNEESLLLRELSGYADYTQEVRYRLLPGVW